VKKRIRFHLLQDERGASLVELAFVLPLFPLLLFGAIDFARAFYLSVEVAGAAQAAALYGSQNPTDMTGMQNAAQADAPNVPSFSVTTATHGCECADGTSYVPSCLPAAPSCTSNGGGVQRVNVTVTGTYSPFIPWPGVPSSMSLSSSASMRSGGS
jgi:Flp pilus assembly protein TadG